MKENCPLSGGKHAIGEKIPEFCRRHCEDRWGEAISKQILAGGYDHFGSDPEGCSGEVENSHDALQSVDDSPTRIYSIIDRCAEHDVELGEQGYQFNCDNN